MKWFRQFSNNCKPWTWALIGACLLLLITWPIRTGPEGIAVGSMVIPLAADSVANGVWRLLSSGSIVVSTFISLLLYAREETAFTGLRRVAVFQLMFILPVLVTGLIRLGHMDSMFRLFMLYSANAIILNGFLLLFAWLFSSRLASAIVLVCFQLMGPILLYLGTFYELLPGFWGKLGLFLYREVPFHQKITAMWSQVDGGALWPDLSLAVLVILFGCIVTFMRHREAEQQVPAEE